MSSDNWTSRDVRFEVYPRQDHRFEPFMDALAERFWEGRPLVTVSGIGSSCANPGVVEVSGFRWWVPKWLALRLVVEVASEVGIVGAATFVTERVTLAEREPR